MRGREAVASIPRAGQGIVIPAVGVGRRASEGCARSPFPAAEDQEIELLAGDPSREAMRSARALAPEGARRSGARSAAVSPFGNADAPSCWRRRGRKEMQLAASPAPRAACVQPFPAAFPARLGRALCRLCSAAAGGRSAAVAAFKMHR